MNDLEGLALRRWRKHERHRKYRHQSHAPCDRTILVVHCVHASFHCPFIFSFTACASFSISSAFFTTVTDSVCSFVLSTYCFSSVASCNNLSVSFLRSCCRFSFATFSAARFCWASHSISAGVRWLWPEIGGIVWSCASLCNPRSKQNISGTTMAALRKIRRRSVL